MIYVISHNNNNMYYNEDHSILYVGNVFDKNYVEDNINNLNPYINELTGLYHIWKNTKEDYVGLAHYRRIFMDANKYMSIDKSIAILQDFDIICTRNYRYDVSLLKVLQIESTNDINILMKYYDILCNIEPDIKQYYEKCRVFNPKNMIICNRDIINRYCEWLFPIIIPITEQFIREDLSNTNNKRLLGFLFERILTYWMKKNNIKKYQCDIKEL